MIHDIDIRVYYEDTDAGGVVYHANYLNFMERGRTEALRQLGLSNSGLTRDEDMIFAVTHVDVRYRRPARLDDLLTVRSKLITARGATLQFQQRIYRGETLLVEADITLACISTAGSPKRIPEVVLQRCKQELNT